MAAPIDPLLIWATNDVVLPISGQQNKIRPQDDLISTGWDKTQKPSAEEFNYILNNLAEWIQYNGTEKLTEFLRKDQNLSDLQNISTAQTNLNVYDKSQVYTKTEVYNKTETFTKTEVNAKQINTGAGLTGGGDLSANRTLSIATPSTVGNGSTNSATNGGSPTHTHSLVLNTSNISMLTGSVVHGGTIPLPAGYTQSQCVWTVSVRNATSTSEDIQTINCFADSNRLVTMNGEDYTGTANYIIIGVK